MNAMSLTSIRVVDAVISSIFETQVSVSLATHRLLRDSTGPVMALVSCGEETLVYRRRRLSASQFVEWDQMNMTTRGMAGISALVSFVHEERVTHSLSRVIDGLGLNHGHGVEWDNDPRFTWWIKKQPLGVRENWCKSILQLNDGLRSAGILLVDCKPEQFVVSGETITLVDRDCLALQGGAYFLNQPISVGYGAAHSRDESVSDAMLRTCFELLTGEHPQAHVGSAFSDWLEALFETGREPGTLQPTISTGSSHGSG